MHIKWETNPAHRNSKLTPYTLFYHSFTEADVFFSWKCITPSLTVWVGRKLGNTTNPFSNLLSTATTMRIARHIIFFRNSKCTASLCSTAYIRCNKDDQIVNTLWWEPVCLIKNILRQYQGIESVPKDPLFLERPLYDTDSEVHGNTHKWWRHCQRRGLEARTDSTQKS